MDNYKVTAKQTTPTEHIYTHNDNACHGVLATTKESWRTRSNNKPLRVTERESASRKANKANSPSC